MDYRLRRKHEVDAIWALELIRDIQRSGWYGSLTFVFEEGKVKRAKRDESLMPPAAKAKTTTNLG